MPAWQDELRTSLLQRDARDQRHAPLIASFHRLARHARAVAHRNAALVQAAHQSHPGPATHAALVADLEHHLALARADLSDQYRLHAATAHRLLALTDALRAHEDRARTDRDTLAHLQTQVATLRDRAQWHREIVADKDHQLELLHDEHASLELELHQLELQNARLQADNAALLQRWLDAKAVEAQRMNDANQFLEETLRLRAQSTSTVPAPTEPAVDPATALEEALSSG